MSGHHDVLAAIGELVVAARRVELQEPLGIEIILYADIEAGQAANGKHVARTTCARIVLVKDDNERRAGWHGERVRAGGEDQAEAEVRNVVRADVGIEAAEVGCGLNAVGRAAIALEVNSHAAGALLLFLNV